MSAFVIKMIACISMLIDHIGYVFEPQLNAAAPWLYTACRIIGRLAFPLFALGVAEGAVRTSSSKKYISRMFLFVLIAQIPFSLMSGLRAASSAPGLSFSLFGIPLFLKYKFSVMVTLFLGLVISSGIHEGKHKGAAVAILAAALLDLAVGMDYGTAGVLFIVALYLARESKALRLLSLLLFSIFLYFSPLKSFAKTLLSGSFTGGVPTGVLYFIGTLSAGIPMVLFNGKKGHSAKLFFYVFYPAHMLILVAVWCMLTVL